MNQERRIRVGVNGYGVIGKRVAAAVASQPDLVMIGVSDVVTDWRAHMLLRNGFRLFGATAEHADAMRGLGLDVAGTLDDLLRDADVIVDCTPKRIAAKNVETIVAVASSSSCTAAGLRGCTDVGQYSHCRYQCTAPASGQALERTAAASTQRGGYVLSGSRVPLLLRQPAS